MPEDFAALADANFLPIDKIENGYTPIVLKTGSEVLLFNTGNGPAWRPDRGALRDATATARKAVDHCDTILEGLLSECERQRSRLRLMGAFDPGCVKTRDAV